MCDFDVKKLRKIRGWEPRLLGVILSHVECRLLDPAIWLLRPSLIFLTLPLLLSKGHRILSPYRCLLPFKSLCTQVFSILVCHINRWTTLTDLLCGQLSGSFPRPHKRDVIVRKICAQLLSRMCQILLSVHSAYNSGYKTRAIIYHEPLRAHEEIIHIGNPSEWVWNHIAVQRWILQNQGFATLETHKLPINWMGQLVVGWFKCSKWTPKTRDFTIIWLFPGRLETDNLD